MSDYNIEYKFQKTDESDFISSVLWTNDKTIGRCFISSEQSVWTISAWYIEKEYQNRGLGRKLLFETCERFFEKMGAPIEIQYNWNGTNSYVFDWLSDNFSPLSLCPINVLKYEDIYPGDIPEGHLYKLDKEAFIKYWKNYLSDFRLDNGA